MMSGSALAVAVAGANGRMGRMLIEAIVAAPDLRLAGALDVAGSPAIGRDAGEFLGQKTGVAVTSSAVEALRDARFMIDFTRPEATLANLPAALGAGIKLVIGTTGFDAAGLAEIDAAAREIAIVQAPNMGVGVNATMKIIELAARLLSDGYDIEVIEAHHRHKIDAPSGTALQMGRVLADATGRDFEGTAVFGRHGETGARPADAIGFSAVRGGDIVGDHTVLFAGTGERIEITHRSTSRASYAAGSLRAVRFLAGQVRGRFDMRDVLGLRD